MEQLVARWAHNPKVTGSSPVPATTKDKPFKKLGGFFCAFTVNPGQLVGLYPPDLSRSHLLCERH